MSHLEQELAVLIELHGLSAPKREYRFASPRRWRFDFAWPGCLVAAECEGGSWVNGAHNRGKHFESDCQKYNAAALRAWLVYRFTGSMIRSGEAIRVLKQALGVQDSD